MAAEQFILAIDQGTTGSTVLVVDVSRPDAPNVVGRKTVDFRQHYPKAGWVEHDLEDIWQSVLEAANGAILAAGQTLPSFQPDKIASIGITNQRETLCAFYRKGGHPATRAIVWQCRRSHSICTELKDKGLEDSIRRKTGLVLDPYFSGSKVSWLMRHNPDLQKLVASGEVLLGTIETYLIYRLTAGKSFVTEPSNASRTMLFDIHAGAFDAELAGIFDVPRYEDSLPQVQPSAGNFGKTQGVDALPDGISITGVLGDQQAALAGQSCFSLGEAKCTYGTGAFLLLNTGSQPVFSEHGLLTTVAWKFGDEITYALEGSAFIAGASIQFLRDQLGFLSNAADSEALAEGVTGAPEVYFVPALVGLGAPVWDPQARGAFFGLTRGTTKNQMIRATLEGMAFQVMDLVNAMRADFSGELSTLAVDGGASANDLLLSVQASLAAVEVSRPVNIETTAFGAAMVSGLGAGIYGSLDSLRSARKVQKYFAADALNLEHKQAWVDGWQRAIKATQVFAGTH